MDIGGMYREAEALMAPFLPSGRLVALFTPVAAAYTIAAAALVGYFRTARRIAAPYTRKIFHFIIFTMAGVIHLTLGLPGVVIFGTVVMVAVLWALYRGERFPFYEALARPSDNPHQSLFIAVPLLTTAGGGVGSNLLFPHVAFIGYLVCGWGDALGEPVGTRWGKHRYRVPSLCGVAATRSLEGSCAVFLGGTLAAFAGLLATGVPLSSAVYVAFISGAAGTAAEAVSTHGLDNLTVQLAAAGAAALVL
jgi:phytol kinase